MDQQSRMTIHLILFLLIPKTARSWLKNNGIKKIFEVVLAVLYPHVSAIKQHSASWQQNLAVEVTYKAKTPKSADNQLLPTAPSWLDGMWRNVMVNGNQSKLLGLGGGGGAGDGREWKGECAFDLGENWSQACRYRVCSGQQQRQQADISERARGLVFRDPPHQALALFIG